MLWSDCIACDIHWVLIICTWAFDDDDDDNDTVTTMLCKKECTEDIFIQ